MSPLGEAGSVHCTVILVLPGLPNIIRLRGTLDAVRKKSKSYSCIPTTILIHSLSLSVRRKVQLLNGPYPLAVRAETLKL